MPLAIRAFPLHRPVDELLEFASALTGPRAAEAGKFYRQYGVEHESWHLQDTPQGTELIVRFAGPGEPFGGVVALEHAPYPVSALAVEPTRLFTWRVDTLRAMLETHPMVRANIMREMTAHMTDALTRVREMTTLRVGARIAITLMRLVRQCGRQTQEGVLITHPLTRQELADLVGTTLYTVSRTLSQWETDGILESHKRHLLIRAPKDLAALAST